MSVIGAGMRRMLKAAATITDPDSVDSPNGGFTAVLSTPSMDRDGDQLQRDEWVEPLPDRITLDVDHLMTAEGTIGSARPYFDDSGRLMIDAAFASTARAQEVRTLVKEGHVGAVSVAFMNAPKTEKDTKPRRELLNAAIVSIPSNREAMILSAKAGARNSASDAKMITAIHDASVALGAQCVEPDPDDDDGSSEGVNKSVAGFMVIGKGLTGSVEDLRDRLQDILCDANPGAWPYLRATFLNDDGTSGTIVYDLGDETWSRTFTADGSAVTLGGSAVAVTIVTSVVPAGAQTDNDTADAIISTTAFDDPDSDDDDDDDPMAATVGGKSATTMPQFMQQLEAIIASHKTSGHKPGRPQSTSPVDGPVDGPANTAVDAAPSGPADAVVKAAPDTAPDAAESDVARRSQHMLMVLQAHDALASDT